MNTLSDLQSAKASMLTCTVIVNYSYIIYQEILTVYSNLVWEANGRRKQTSREESDWNSHERWSEWRP